MKRIKILLLVALLVAFCAVFPNFVCSADIDEKLTINAVAPEFPPDSPLAEIVGQTWYIYLEGYIDKDAAKRLNAEIITRNIKDAFVFFNSNGGSLVAGMEIGRLIRKYGFSTFVGSRPERPMTQALPGECYSACVLAFIGGYYRYQEPGSKIGVHRFYSALPTDSAMDIAQILSAKITNYLLEMGVDVRLFDRMSKAGKDELYILDKDEARELRVTNEGKFAAKWSIEVLGQDGTLYLKGEQEAWYGIGKVLFSCSPDGQLIFGVIYEAGSNCHTIIDYTVRYSIRIDDEFIPLGKPIKPMIAQNGCLLSDFVLNKDHIIKLSTAKFIGWAAHPGNPDIYYGFKVDTKGNLEKINGFLKSCPNSAKLVFNSKLVPANGSTEIEMPKPDEDAITNSVHNYYELVQKKDVDGALGCYASEKRSQIKRSRLEAIAKDTEYYRIEKINVIAQGSEKVKTVTSLKQKKYNQPIEAWEVNIEFVKEDGQWKIWNNTGKKIFH